MKRSSFHHPRRSGGFTLVEVLVVIAMMVLLSALAIPALTSLQKANDVNSATSTIASMLDQARAFAMANNTYVVIGVEETNFSTPATQAQAPGTGRVALQAFSSLDGTLNLASANLRAVSRVTVLNGIDLPASLEANTGTLPQRSAASYIVGSSEFPSASGNVASGNFTFSKMIAFDPHGEIYLPTDPPQSGLQYLEIDLQQSNGSAASSTAKDLSAIQIDGLTGAVTVFRS